MRSFHGPAHFLVDPRPTPRNITPWTPARPSTHDLLDDYILLSLSLPQLAKRHNLSLRALIDFLDNPETQRTLADLRRHAAQRARDASIHARAAAIETLVLHATADPTSESARRAAIELLRDRVRTRRPAHRRPAVAESTPTHSPAPRRLRTDLRAALRLARLQQRKRESGAPLTADDRARATAMSRRLGKLRPVQFDQTPVQARAGPTLPTDTR